MIEKATATKSKKEILPFSAEAEQLIHNVGRYDKRKADMNVLSVLALSEADYPVISVKDECFLFALCTKEFCGVVWLSDWFQFESVSSSKGTCTVALAVNGESIEVGYGAFVPKKIPELADYGIVANYDHSSELSKYVYRKLSAFTVRKEDTRIGFVSEYDALKFLGYETEKPVFSYTSEPIAEYAEKLNGLLTNPNIAFALCCGCASLFLTYLRLACKKELKSFFISLYGKTTTGKSTAQSLIASIYTDPADKKVYIPFFGTSNAIIKAISNKFGVPQIFDEATVAKKLKMDEMIYTVSLERDKQRCNNNAELRQSEIWNTVVITSSENKLLHETQMSNKGLEPRCLSFGGLQYTDSREHSEQIQSFSADHYGVIGKAVSEYLIGADARVIAQQFDECRERLRTAIGNHSIDITERLINEYALILQAAVTLKGMGFSIDESAVISIITDNHEEISENCNIAERYYNYLMAYVAANPFSPSVKKDAANGTVALIYTQFEQLLERHGATNIKLVVDELSGKGYLIRGSKKTPKKRLRFNGQLSDCYILKLPEQNGRTVNGGITLAYILENYEGLDES